MMWEAARDFVVGKGNRVLMDHALQQLSFDKKLDRWRVAAKTGEGKSVVINAAHVISSAPIRELTSRIHPLPKAAANALNLRYRDFLTVALMIRSKDIFPDNWIYIHDSEGEGRADPELPQLVAGDGAGPGLACVGLEYFCFEGDGLWTSSDEELIDLAKKEMAILGMSDPADVEGGVVVRQEKAYPVYDDYYRDNVEAIREELETAYPTLHLVGRNGMHRYNNQDHAMMTAMLTRGTSRPGAAPTTSGPLTRTPNIMSRATRASRRRWRPSGWFRSG